MDAMEWNPNPRPRRLSAGLNAAMAAVLLVGLLIFVAVSPRGNGRLELQPAAVSGRRAAIPIFLSTLPRRPCHRLGLHQSFRRAAFGSRAAEENLTQDDIKQKLEEAEAEAAKLREKLMEKSSQISGSAPADPSLSDLTSSSASAAVENDAAQGQIVNNNPLKRGGRQGNDMVGPSEAQLMEELGYNPDQEQIGDVIRRRFLIAAAGGGLLAALASVPTSNHKIPKEPASAFLPAVIRSSYILDDVKDAIERKRWKKELDLVHTILDKPNFIKKNLQMAAQTLVSDDEWRTADGLGKELAENIRALDYQEFFQTNEPNDDQINFLTNGVEECQLKLKEFLMLMDPNELQKATAEAQRTKSAVARDENNY